LIPEQFLTPTGIASTETFGVAVVAGPVICTGIATAEALGAVVVAGPLICTSITTLEEHGLADVSTTSEAARDASDLISQAHYNAALILNKRVSIYTMNGPSPVIGGTSLVAIIRNASTREQELGSHFGINIDRVFEIAKQGTLDLSKIRPQKHLIRYGGVYWQILTVNMDDAEYTISDEITASVHVFTCARLQRGGIAEMVT
jgi:hypothetical protein